MASFELHIASSELLDAEYLYTRHEVTLSIVGTTVVHWRAPFRGGERWLAENYTVKTDDAAATVRQSDKDQQVEHLPAPASSWKRTRCGSPGSPGIDLATNFSSAISPTSVAAAFGYPRPQMTRADSSWTSLNGLWEAQPFVPLAGHRPPFGRTLNATILVPFPVESCLSGVRNLTAAAAGNDVPPTYRYIYYRTHVRVSAAAASSSSLLLHFGAVDWQAVVYVNGIWVGSHEQVHKQPVIACDF